MKATANALLDQAAAVLNQTTHQPGKHGRLRVGVDLGTAVMAVFVVDERGHPIAARSQRATVVRDGLVVDYMGAIDLLRDMRHQLSSQLGADLSQAVTGFPPGVPGPERQALANVVEAAGFNCMGLIDEPSAANAVLALRDGAIVDVGGGTTGIAILQRGRVKYTADEATGGTHFNLVIAGALNITYEQAEQLKEDPAEQARLAAIVRPVMEKVGTITARHIDGQSVRNITLVGGASQFPGMAEAITDITRIPTEVAPHAQWVTPLGLALAQPAEQWPASQLKPEWSRS